MTKAAKPSALKTWKPRCSASKWWTTPLACGLLVAWIASGCTMGVPAIRPPLALPPLTRPPLVAPVSDEWLAWLGALIEQSEQNCRVLAAMRGEPIEPCVVP